MPSVLGKRKSRSQPTPSSSSISAEEAQEVFRRHFEADFKPLPKVKKPKPAKVPEERQPKEESDSEWGGVSDVEDDGSDAVEVVDHTATTIRDDSTIMTKRDLRAFMSSRPPTSTSSSKIPPPPPPQEPESENDALLKAQDLALQRLLSESHLLSHLAPGSAHSKASSLRPFASGKLRHKTTDLRIQSLASGSSPTTAAKKTVESIYDQKKMPMAMRKRINATQQAREDKRRREARENGIILETGAKKKGKSAVERSQRGGSRAFTTPSVGKLRGAELKLSERDIRSIEAGGQRRGGGKGRR